MKLYIQTAEYKQYNANNRGNNSPDCVKRALSMAFNVDYNQVSKELNAIMKEKRSQFWNIKRIYDVFIANHGGSTEQFPYVDPHTGELLESTGGPITVEAWIDRIGSKGTYVLETSKKSSGKRGLGDHLTCTIDGKLFDSWDSREQYVCGYYIVSTEETSVEFTDIQSHLDELRDFACDLLMAEANKQAKVWYGDTREFHVMQYRRKSVPGEPEPPYRPGKVDGYSLKFPCRFQIEKFDNTHTYDFTVAYPFTPTTSLEAAKKKIKDLTKIRIYDRFYAIKADLKKKEEAYEMSKQLKDHSSKDLYLTDQETRFINTLPGWVRPLITWIYIRNPGQYSDSYDLTIRPLPGDSNTSKVNFRGYNASDIREEIQLYKDGYQRLGEDYFLEDIIG